MHKSNRHKIKYTGDSARILSVRQMALIGLMTSIICIMAPISIVLPISPVPISLGTMAIYFVLLVLGLKRGFISVCIYILLGFVGLPVFSGFTGGLGKLLGPTGGYIIGYLFMALICGFFADQCRTNLLFPTLGAILGTVVCYAFGTIWLVYQTQLTFSTALITGVLPFIPGDIAKMAIALPIGHQVRKRLVKAGLI